ncbi:MAG: RagB/SusD family nutrient uptake outer membrane protein [Mangrovibacterium sp.]
MKRIKYITGTGMILLAILLISFSCTELDNKSYNEIIASQYTITEDDMTALLGAAYNWDPLLLQWNRYWRQQELTADENIIPARPNGWSDGGIYKRLHQHTWTAQDDNVYETWYECYTGITSCNRVIYQLQSGAIPTEDADTKSKATSELRALRASYYWVLCDLYGNVPLSTDYNVAADYLPEQSTRKEVYDFIVSELTDCMDSLTSENNSSTYGRFNEWAARFLLAKVYLNAEVYSGTAHWSDCLEQCNEIINSGNFALESDQKNIFVTDNENNSEMIFAIALDENYTTAWNTFDLHMQTLQPANQATYQLSQTPWGGICATPQFISTFDPEDKRLTENYISGQQYSYDGDILYCTLGDSIGKPLYYVNAVPSITESQEDHGYRLGKFEIAVGSSNILNNDFPLFRYTEVLMMKAECLLRLGSADEAAEIVTQVRERDFDDPGKARVTGDELTEGSSYDYGLRDNNSSTEEGGEDIVYGRFLDELGWEFNQEGHRRTDLIRFGIFTTKSWFSHSPNGSYRSIYPIPTTILETNGNLTQNTGY